MDTAPLLGLVISRSRGRLPVPHHISKPRNAGLCGFWGLENHLSQNCRKMASVQDSSNSIFGRSLFMLLRLPLPFKTTGQRTQQNDLRYVPRAEVCVLLSHGQGGASKHPQQLQHVAAVHNVMCGEGGNSGNRGLTPFPLPRFRFYTEICATCRARRGCGLRLTCNRLLADDLLMMGKKS